MQAINADIVFFCGGDFLIWFICIKKYHYWGIYKLNSLFLKQVSGTHKCFMCWRYWKLTTWKDPSRGVKENREKRGIENRVVKFIGSTVVGTKCCGNKRKERFLQVSDLGRFHGGIKVMCDVTRACLAKEVAHAKTRKHKKRDVFRDPQRVPFGWEMGSMGKWWERWQVAGRSWRTSSLCFYPIGSG